MVTKLWTTVEVAALREAWPTDAPMESMAARFGRSNEAVRSKARELQLGLRPDANRPWTEADDAELRRLWAEKGSLKSHLHRLPGRSWRAALERAKRLGLTARGGNLKNVSFSWVDVEVRKALADGRQMTVTQIYRRVKAARGTVAEVLERSHGTAYRIAGWGRTDHGTAGALWPVWAIGSEPDVPRPPARSRNQYMRDWRAARRVKSGAINPFSTIAQQVAA
ncbi:hypothetical protein [Caballeronia sp. LZ035]|uniref:hypothetical protein n=1 Tax=Caballeronia sp. LZ035 TaxID=3038568 RepID=UPI00286745B9|nr:hypothetical protein [Caballeronia sp. LZ035]MDR5761937.1 hypothetical protein [Caballeronia sp. LZ035]